METWMNSVVNIQYIESFILNAQLFIHNIWTFFQIAA